MLTTPLMPAAPQARPRHQVQSVLLLAAYGALSVVFIRNVLAAPPSPAALPATFAFWGVVGLAAAALAVGLWTGRLQPEDV